MKVIDGDVNVNSDIFKRNYESMAQINQDLDAKIGTILNGGGEAANKRHLGRGKFLGTSFQLIHHYVLFLHKKSKL